MTSKRLLVVVACLALRAVPVLCQARGKGGGGGRPEPPPAGDLYGDLYVIERDGNGEPILRDVTYTYTDSETGETVTDTASCQQPLAEGCGLLPFWGECGTTLPGNILPLPACTFDPEAYDPCAVYSGEAPYDYANQVQEVSFGRASVARSQPFVIDSAYAEAIKTLNVATAFAFDPAGRIKLVIPSEDDPLTSVDKTIDAPLENLGLYRALMTTGCLGRVTDEVVTEGGVTSEVTYALDESAIALLEAAAPELVCAYTGPDPEVPENPAGVTATDMLLASSFMGAATDKSDPLSLDEIINVNTYLKINDYTYVKDKKDWNLQVTYFSFRDPAAGYGSEDWFGYTRSTRFAATAAADLLVYDTLDEAFTTVAGLPLFSDPPVYQVTTPYFRVDLDEVNIAVCRGGYVDAEICDAAADDAAYSDTDPQGCGGANWFAQAAEHARKTVWYLHNWAVPELDN